MHCVVNELGKGMLHKAKARSIAAAAVCPVWKWEKRGGGGASVCTGKDRAPRCQCCHRGWAGAGEAHGEDPEAVCLHHLTSPCARTEIARAGL